jgi:AAHS family 4-hydroxybenzoate transporter-like MFS transporter
LLQPVQKGQEEFFDVQGFVDERRIVLAQWLILALCFLVLVIDGFHTAVMAFIAPVLSRELSIPKASLGLVLAASLIGLAFGALVAGPFADRFGRRRVLLASVALCGVGSLISASLTSLNTLSVYRFITGLGIGAAMPNCVTLASEFVPAKWRALLLNLMFCGFPLGASAAGFVAAWLLPNHGWRFIFLAGGAVPLVLMVLLTRLPESISFMVVREYPLEKIKSALRQISGGESEALRKIDEAVSFKTAESAIGRDRMPWKAMFDSSFLVGTLMLWLTYFMGLLLYYLLTSWMPTFVRGAGYSVSQAAVATALFPLGGVFGATLCGWLMGRVNSTRVVSGAYLLTAVLLVVLACSTTHFGSLLCATFLAGLAMNGAQTSMPVLAAEFYPTYGRASGVAWMLGVGRVGGITGVFGGGLLFQAGFSLKEVFSWLTLAAGVAALALFCKDIYGRRLGDRQASIAAEEL